MVEGSGAKAAACTLVLALAPLPLFAGGCTKKEPPKVGTYSFEMSITGFEMPEEGVEIVYEDDVLGHLKPRVPSVTVTLPDDVYLTDVKGRLRIRVAGTCGKQDIPLRIPFADHEGEAARLRTAAGGVMSFETENAAVARVYYDNEGLPATGLIVGAIAREVAAGDHGMFSVVLGTCGTARQVLVGGQRLGELPSQPLAPDAPIGAFVDLKGGRCYKRRPHFYDAGVERKKDDKAAPKPPPTRDGGAPDPIRSEAVLKGQRVYAVATIEDFFNPSPPQLRAGDDVKPLVVRTELLRCDDPRANGHAAPASPVVAAAPPTPKKKPPGPTPLPKKK